MVDVCEELKANLQSVFTIQDTSSPVTLNCDEEIIESIEIFKRNIYKLLKKLDPYKARGLGGISLYVLRQSIETPER